ncbi:MAG: ribonucleoside-diphosphate reductase subunit alpha, partial [Gemmatimonadaceae bacterium]
MSLLVDARASAPASAGSALIAAPPTFHVIRRNGAVSPFDATKIAVAMTKAFLAVEGTGAATSPRVREIVESLCAGVIDSLTRRADAQRALHIEDIQDQVELALMRGGHHKVARAYVLYRESRAQVRRAEGGAAITTERPKQTIQVRDPDGALQPVDLARLGLVIEDACAGLEGVSTATLIAETTRNLYDGMSADELALAPTMAARAMVEIEPNYAYASARLLLDRARTEALSFVLGTPTEARQDEMDYATYFPAYVARAVDLRLLDPELLTFDLSRMAAALRPERDLYFQFLGLQTLHDRYFIQTNGTRIELPQAFFMRVAMGLALREIDREARAIEFYEVLSSFDMMCSTPTLFNAGTPRPQLSSCFLTTVPDDLDGIFASIKDNALLAKYSGGLGNDWTRVRGLGAHIRGTNGTSQGVVPFLKVANDTAVAVNQGGKRKGAVCAYLETWHIDIEEFLDLRKNTGDDRRRTHDMNTAAWVPDLFMQRVAEDGRWTLFSPDDVPDLHDLYGQAFATRYAEHEARVERGEITLFKRVRATDLWRRMLTMLFETGHPWITFKDACNLRSPQQHVGVIHSSNLCTEITLNTSDDEVAVCNLGSINLATHVARHGIDHTRLERTTRIAARMLDNVIDINLYTIPEARRSNLRHRPIGLGIMGFQDALYTRRLPYASEEAVKFADETMEAVSFYAISASADLAEERGRYPSFAGSLWSKGCLPIDSLELLAADRGAYLETDFTTRFDWGELRARVSTVGVRNSN